MTKKPKLIQIAAAALMLCGSFNAHASLHADIGAGFVIAVLVGLVLLVTIPAGLVFLWFVLRPNANPDQPHFARGDGSVAYGFLFAAFTLAVATLLPIGATLQPLLMQKLQYNIDQTQWFGLVAVIGTVASLVVAALLVFFYLDRSKLISRLPKPWAGFRYMVLGVVMSVIHLIVYHTITLLLGYGQAQVITTALSIVLLWPARVFLLLGLVSVLTSTRADQGSVGVV